MSTEQRNPAATQEATILGAMSQAPCSEAAATANVAFDGADRLQAGVLRAEAMRCRRLAQSVTDRQAVDTLLVMAGEYDTRAQSLLPL